MNGVHAGDRFQFKDDFPFNQEIKAVAAFQSQPLAFYWQWFLLYELQAPQGKLSGKTSLIN